MHMAWLASRRSPLIRFQPAINGIVQPPSRTQSTTSTSLLYQFLLPYKILCDKTSLYPLLITFDTTNLQCSKLQNVFCFDVISTYCFAFDPQIRLPLPTHASKNGVCMSERRLLASAPLRPFANHQRCMTHSPHTLPPGTQNPRTGHHCQSNTSRCHYLRLHLPVLLRRPDYTTYRGHRPRRSRSTSPPADLRSFSPILHLPVHLRPRLQLLSRSLGRAPGRRALRSQNGKRSLIFALLHSAEAPSSLRHPGTRTLPVLVCTHLVPMLERTGCCQVGRYQRPLAITTAPRARTEEEKVDGHMTTLF